MTTDFSKGSPTKMILMFTIPYLIGNLFQQFYNIADTVIVGQTLNVQALAAVGATGSLVWFASGAIQALTTGFSAVMAQRFGAKDMHGVKQSFALSIVLTVIISIIITALTTGFAMPILRLLNTPSDIIQMSYDYIIWIFAGLIATAVYNLLSNMIRALGDSKTPLYFLIVACIINIILDYVLIVGFGFGTDGAGIATVAAQLISSICCVVYIIKKVPLLHITKEDFEYNGNLVLNLLTTGLPMAFLNMVISIGGIITQFVYNGLNTLAVAAYTAANKLEQFIIQPYISLGAAVSVYVAQNYGAKEYERIKNGVMKSLLMGWGWTVIGTIIMVIIGKTALGLIISPDGVTAQEYNIILSDGYYYIIVNTVLSCILSPLVVLKSALQPVGRALMPMISGFTEIIGRGGTALMLAPIFGFAGVCFANPCAWLFGLIPIAIDYLFMLKKFKSLEN